mmetsp:Transcript_40463/g.128924  ORF Transcript_40463/g.128924 Transcript_40463/m.128924 type:complete len:501 (-) Transcript_40463:226-1728(-)
MMQTNETVFRILGPQKATGRVIGRGGEVINAIRAQSGCQIQVEDLVVGCPERIVSIHGNDAGAQNALMQVAEHLLEGDGDVMGDGEAHIRLLVPSAQVGGIIGKGGAYINDIRAKTGCNLRVCDKDERPIVALLSDELVAMSGDPKACKVALMEVAKLVVANPVQQRPGGPRAFAGPKLQVAQQLEAASGGAMALVNGLPLVLNGVGAIGLTGTLCGNGGSGAQIQYRVIVPVSRVGGVIGKGGETISRLRDECGAAINIHDLVPGTEERLMTISSNDTLGRSTPAQDALVGVFLVMTDGTSDSRGEVTVQVLVPQTQVGQLLGKGGNIIQSMRDDTGAVIRILPKEELPAFAEDGDELLQITAPPSQALYALRTVAARMRNTPNGKQTDTRNPIMGQATLPPVPGMTAMAGAAAPFPGMAMAAVGPQSEVEINVTQAQAGAIIGRGGANISQIRSASGAAINMGTNEPGSDHRTIKVTGSTQQVELAKQLIQAFAAQAV